MAKAPGPETVSRDVDCLLHSYVAPERSEASLDTLDCPLQALGLIRVVGSGPGGEERQYRFQNGPKATLPAAIFFYALARFWRCPKNRKGDDGP